MNLKSKELELILNWFSLTEGSLDDDDLKLYDKIKEDLEDGGDDPLYFEPPDESEGYDSSTEKDFIVDYEDTEDGDDY